MTATEVIYDALLDGGLLAANEAQWMDSVDLVVDRLKAAGYTILPPSITRVHVVQAGTDHREHWADMWTPYIQDDGRTLKLFAHGKGTAAQAERSQSLGRDLAAQCLRCGGSGGEHKCGRELDDSRLR